jgi:hypothetical protein
MMFLELLVNLKYEKADTNVVSNRIFPSFRKKLLNDETLQQFSENMNTFLAVAARMVNSEKRI